jgi:hypothetical protein
MNWMILISGLAAGFVNLGHFTVGSKDFLNPMLQADFDDVPKKVMHGSFLWSLRFSPGSAHPNFNYQNTNRYVESRKIVTVGIYLDSYEDLRASA